MFGPRFNTIFASRWRALWFAASTLLLAYCTVPADDEQVAPAKPAHHVNPWALDKKQ